VRPSQKVSEGVNRKPGSKSSFFGRRHISTSGFVRSATASCSWVSCYLFWRVQFCNALGVEFLVFRLWISVWIGVFAIVVVMLEGAFLVRYFTRFMQEIFIALISLIFIYETFKKIFVVSWTLSGFYDAVLC